MSIFRTPQVILFSTDVSRAAAFYTKLGFTETFRVPTDREPIHIDPHVCLDRLLIAWTADPDGNPIQIVQSLSG
jgi:hypothetical protein